MFEAENSAQVILLTMQQQQQTLNIGLRSGADEPVSFKLGMMQFLYQFELPWPSHKVTGSWER